MENTNIETKAYLFDAFLTKTIIYSSNNFFRKEVKRDSLELNILDDENFLNDSIKAMSQEDNIFSSPSDFTLSFENFQLEKALKSLSKKERFVIIMIFCYSLSLDDLSILLSINYKSVSRIKLRALKKLKDFREGENYGQN